jgi:hypothetical protein
VVEKGRTALLAILGLVNVVVVAIFLYHIIKQFWLWIGAPASKALGTMYKNGKFWWAGNVHSKLEQQLQGGLKWPPSWWGSGKSGLCGSLGWGGRKVQQGQLDGTDADKDDDTKAPGDAQQQQEQQQGKDPEQQVNGHAPPGILQPKQQGDADPPALQQQQQQQQQRKQQWGKLTWWMHRGRRQPDQEAGLADAEAQDNAQQQQQQQQANGHAPPSLQQQ